MMTEQQERLVSLLLGTFPNFQSGDAEAALAAYAMVITRADPRDVEPGIMMLINGELPGFDGRFAPTSTQLARAIRVCLERRVDAEIAARKALPPPPDDWVDDTPEQKARNKATLDALAQSLAAEMRTEEAENDRKRHELGNRTNAYFAPSFSNEDMSRRLGIGGARFTVGDPDADTGDMGGRDVA